MHTTLFLILELLLIPIGGLIGIVISLMLSKVISKEKIQEIDVYLLKRTATDYLNKEIFHNYLNSEIYRKPFGH